MEYEFDNNNRNFICRLWPSSLDKKCNIIWGTFIDAHGVTFNDDTFEGILSGIWC